MREDCIWRSRLEQVREQEQERVLERVPVPVLERVPVLEPERAPVLEQERALEQVRGRARADACQLVPREAQARAAVITPHHGNCASDRGRWTSHPTTLATRRIRFLKS